MNPSAAAPVPFRLIAGPCVIENRDLVFQVADQVSSLCRRLGVEFVFKASFDKANRSSGQSYRGPGPDEGLAILAEVREHFGVPVLTDIHESHQAAAAAQAVDVLQIPAFLCRQSDLLEAAARAVAGTGKCVNVKKGQFLAPWDMAQVVNKLADGGLVAGSGRLWLTERGSSFGYNTLVVDFRSLPQLQALGCPVIFDATHAVQQPGGRGTSSGGQREFVATLARAAMAVGVDGLFMEVHPDPEQALSDGPNMVPLHRLEAMLRQLLAIRAVVAGGTAESSL
ncbi:3-deoxy-8-phosphooctulonate synthase [Cyanobium sp. Cruz CV13-4-11]|jgi:2-dehydro-3-deoxyphosphooctonate aldolase (KDO 8-P synthase)|uniref:3-deoxy-8-phosphooctulonate synthase n=1 Tax=unclassified Cyanobium TaxID=2627006 RepID=UPI0020CDF5F2|nr:3-deoxy-8-phosphooctulonate synthase [Cyanobium sp. Cruz CV11-17]MCP9901988.1 3-deoxy-8-phosphooctulonate synthase [Cyanobium sp. Cruz CV11-17]MCP9920685.1 3-deoxy-8-phosphooctulonate synthase [Cyanobium sp. Cruz CV13-4-11]